MRRLAFALALTFSLTACGGGGNDDDFDGDVEEASETGVLGRMGQMRDAMEQMQEQADRPPAEPINFRELREHLPAEIDGIAQGETEGSTDGFGGFSISKAGAEYTADDNRKFDVTITDLGALPSAAMFGLGWTMADIDRESGTTSERTVTLGGNRGYRKYDAEARDGEFSLFVADRFHVQVKGSGVDEDAIEAALRSVDLAGLAARRDEGRPDA